MIANGPNEPAFPRPCGAANSEEQNLEQSGMTMREWYAGMAASVLARFLSDPEMVKVAATNAFAIADALLAESRKERKP